MESLLPSLSGLPIGVILQEGPTKRLALVDSYSVDRCVFDEGDRLTLRRCAELTLPRKSDGFRGIGIVNGSPTNPAWLGGTNKTIFVKIDEENRLSVLNTKLIFAVDGDIHPGAFVNLVDRSEPPVNGERFEIDEDGVIRVQGSSLALGLIPWQRPVIIRKPGWGGPG